MSANEIEQQNESCDEPQETEDRGDCDGCGEHEKQRDESGGDDDDENRENDSRDELRGRERSRRTANATRKLEESKHADRRRVSRQLGSNTNWTRHQLLLGILFDR